MDKRWTLLPKEEESTRRLVDQLKIHSEICRVLVQRGVDDFEKARAYFRPSLKELHSPWLMKGMDAAVQRVMQAIERKEKILVYGDYDVDGTTSVACMIHFLRTLKLSYEPELYIPNRYREGYGISLQGVEYAVQNGFSLVIAIDCGVRSNELIALAKEQGVDFIVCDHHIPGEILPPAVAILNPKQEDCTYPFKDLCGCGVGFKLITALAERMGLTEDVPFRYLDLVATAIAADIVPMVGENRVLAYYGLKKANTDPNLGIQALKELSGVSKELDIGKLVFMISPRVNAAGRMDDARKAVELFLAKGKEDALKFAQYLHTDNDERKEADQTITAEALSILRSDPAHLQKKTTVVYRPHWRKGVIGIVASRLTEHYYRPTIVLTNSGDTITGSARSVNGFNVYEAIDACAQHLKAYGGHFAAAGLTLLPEKLEQFATAFEEAVQFRITDDQLIPDIEINATLDLSDITPAFFRILKQMEPFGPENMRPVFLTKKVRDTGYSSLVKEEHLKLVVSQSDTTLTGIFFRGAAFLPVIQAGDFDIVYTLEENEFRGTKTIQLQVIDIRPSGKDVINS